MIINSHSDYYFNEAKLITSVIEKYQDFSYKYFQVDSPVAEDIHKYFIYNSIDEKYYQAREFIEGEEYFIREINLDENGDPVLIEFEAAQKLEIKFKYKIVDPADASQIFLVDDLPGKSEILIIKTDDNISPKKYIKGSKENLTDRILIDGKFYTISNLYKELKSSSNTMFGKPKFTTYIVLGG